MDNNVDKEMIKSIIKIIEDFKNSLNDLTKQYSEECRLLIKKLNDGVLLGNIELYGFIKKINYTLGYKKNGFKGTNLTDEMISYLKQIGES